MQSEQARCRTAPGPGLPGRLGIVTAITVIFTALPVSPLRAAGSLVENPNLVDDKFEAYILQPCLDGLLTLINVKGWTILEAFEYDQAICDVFFNQGNFNNANGTTGYVSSVNAGTASAQSKTSDTNAREQIDSIEDRLAEIKEEEDQPRGGIGVLLAVQEGETERVSTDNEVGFDSDLDGVVAGLDYRFNDKLVTGFALGNTKDDAKFDSSNGFLETESRSILVYSTYLISDQAYLDFYLGVAELEYETRRDLSIDGSPGDNFGFSGTVTADYEGDQNFAGISSGYDWYRGNFSYGVSAAVDYIKTEVDDYVESGNTNLELEFRKQDFKSLTLGVGVNGSYSIDVGWGSLIPNFGIVAYHEYESDARKLNARLVVMPDVDQTSLTLETDDPDRDYFIVTLGFVVATNAGAQFFVTYEQLEEHRFIDNSSLSAGVLYEF